MRLSVLAAALLLAGCGTSLPSKFYVLTAEPAPPRFGAPAGSTVALGRVSLPGALDRPALARRRGGNEIVYAEEERWAGPFDDMVRRVLADDLAARLPAGVTLVADAAALEAARWEFSASRWRCARREPQRRGSSWLRPRPRPFPTPVRRLSIRLAVRAAGRSGPAPPIGRSG